MFNNVLYLRLLWIWIKKHYPKDWIVLQNRVVECYRSMSLDEKRLFIMATPLANHQNIKQ